MEQEEEKVQTLSFLANTSELSRRSGIHVNTLQRVFSGKGQPSMRTLTRLGETLGLGIQETLALIDLIKQYKGVFRGN